MHVARAGEPRVLERRNARCVQGGDAVADPARGMDERLAAARASGQMAQYISQITAKIEGAWNPPPSATAGLQCEVRVTQVQGGVVTAVKVERCNGDAAVKQSIEDAVYRASPLPQPPDPALFERNLVVTFRPDN